MQENKTQQTEEQELVYRLEIAQMYFKIQRTEEGYDYTFYKDNYLEWDGGVYDNPDISLEEAMEDILEDEGYFMSDCEPIDYEAFMDKVEEKEKEQMQKIEAKKETSLLSNRITPEDALHGQSCADIEEMVLSYAQGILDELEDEVQLLGARVYGSRTREGLYTDTSDVDVLLSYTGNIREDAFFNILHEEKLKIGGLIVDINPISIERTGTLEESLRKSEKYLDEKAVFISEKEQVEENFLEATLTYYVAEYMEFPALGKYHENLTLQEAVDIYKNSEEGFYKIEGIGIDFEDGTIYSGKYPLMVKDKIDIDTFYRIQHLREHPLVQRAVTDMQQEIPIQFLPLEEYMREDVKHYMKEQGWKSVKRNKESVLKTLKECQAKMKKSSEQLEKKTETYKKEEQQL